MSARAWIRRRNKAPRPVWVEYPGGRYMDVIPGLWRIHHEDDNPLPDAMLPGWDPETPGREMERRFLDSLVLDDEESPADEPAFDHTAKFSERRAFPGMRGFSATETPS